MYTSGFTPAASLTYGYGAAPSPAAIEYSRAMTMYDAILLQNNDVSIPVQTSFFVSTFLFRLFCFDFSVSTFLFRRRGQQESSKNKPSDRDGIWTALPSTLPLQKLAPPHAACLGLRNISDFAETADAQNFHPLHDSTTHQTPTLMQPVHFARSTCFSNSVHAAATATTPS